MAILPIYTFNQSVLRKKAKPVKHVDAALVRLVQDMFDTMHNANGIGLAANQVGSLQRLIVVDLAGMEETAESPIPEVARQPLAMLNPEVLSESGNWAIEEGCLSIPEIRDEVDRVHAIHVRYKDLEFKDRELNASGLLARVILHEIDHINGILFIDHLGAVKKKLLRGRLNKIARGEVEVSYPVVSSAAVGVEAA